MLKVSNINHPRRLEAKEALELILPIEENDCGESADEKSETSQSEIDCHPSTAVQSLKVIIQEKKL